MPKKYTFPCTIHISVWSPTKHWSAVSRLGGFVKPKSALSAKFGNNSDIYYPSAVQKLADNRVIYLGSLIKHYGVYEFSFCWMELYLAPWLGFSTILASSSHWSKTLPGIYSESFPRRFLSASRSTKFSRHKDFLYGILVQNKNPYV